MRIISPSFSIIDNVDGAELLKRIEAAGRTCYKSEANITDESAHTFVSNILKRGHESVIEHEKLSVRIICDRGVTHEIVRHRLASYSQESTRYCNYSNDGELTFIKPFFWEGGMPQYETWKNSMESAEQSYLSLIKLGATPQEARDVLPNSLKTEIVVTMNLREWRHFFRMRADTAAHPQMREIAVPMLLEFRKRLPVFFDDILPELTTWP